MTTKNKVVVILNRKAGRQLGDSEQVRNKRLHELFSGIGMTPQIHWVEPADLVDILHQVCAGKPRMVVVGGGDGTLHTAANVLVESSIPLGVLPLGTFNHFAKDLRLPLALDAAVKVLSQGVIRFLDVGEVNGQVFLNNASVGIYPYAVRRRNLYQQRLGLPKLAAMGYALWGVLWRLPSLKVWLSIGGRREFIKTPFIFLGNNRYQVNPVTGIYRQTLDEGLLSVFYVRRVGRLTLIKIALKTLFGRVLEAPDLEALMTESVILETNGKMMLRLAMDGEVMMMRSPLKFHIRHRVLRVIVPQAAFT